MGAGSASAGATPAGIDPVAAPPPARDVKPPTALYYDGATRSFPLDADGHYQGIHPVDQAVALALILSLGTITSAPGAGAGFRQVKRITSATKKQVEDMARAALRPRVVAQDIKVLSILVETKGRPTGGFAVAVNYVNLRTRPPKPSTVKLPSIT